MSRKSIDTPIVEEFMEFYDGLTPNLTPYSAAQKRLHSVLPRLPDYLKKLSNGNSRLLKVIVDRMRGACEYAYERRDWDGFVSLSLQGSNLPLDHGDYGLTYVHNTGPFHESVAWILTRECEDWKRKPIPHAYDDGFSEPDWIKEERFVLVEPARLYNRWYDVKEDKPVEEFKSVEEILEYEENLNGKSFLVFPKVRIKGLSISKNRVEETPFNIQNWFGEDSSLMVSRLPRNPYWDT